MIRAGGTALGAWAAVSAVQGGLLHRACLNSGVQSGNHALYLTYLQSRPGYIIGVKWLENTGIYF